MARPKKEEELIINPAPIEEPMVIKGENTDTIEEIRGMGVIQLHNLIRNKYPQFQELLDIYARETLQNKLIKALEIG